MQTTNDATRMMTYDANKKSVLVSYVLWWFFGMFGAHRFYLSRIGSAVAMLIITLVSIPLILVVIGLFGLMITGIWALVDLFLIPSICRDYNMRLASALTPTQ